MDRFDLHSSTFAGNAFSCTAARETLKVVEEENLVANSAERGRQLLDGLRQRLGDHPLVRDIRGRGLLAGIELGSTDRYWLNRLAPVLVEMVSRGVFGQWLALQLLERGIICQPAAQRWNVLKLEPPLTVRAEQVDEMIKTLAEVLDDYRGIGSVLGGATERLARQFLSGWKF